MNPRLESLYNIANIYYTVYKACFSSEIFDFSILLEFLYQLTVTYGGEIASTAKWQLMFLLRIIKKSDRHTVLLSVTG